MAESDYAEFGIAHDRVYTLEHLWLQSFDVKSRSKHEEDQIHVKIGLSEFLRAEYGDIVRVVLPHPQESGNFTLDVDEDSDDEQLSSVAPPLAGDEIGLGDLLITVRTINDRILINAPFPCKVLELNGDVEDNSDLVNDEAYGDGWCIIVKPHDFDQNQFLNVEEYIEMLNEL
jgi:glycine cleavage system H protein